MTLVLSVMWNALFFWLDATYCAVCSNFAGSKRTGDLAGTYLFSALLGLVLNWGVIGVTIGRSIDLVFRGAIFVWRLRSQKRINFRLILRKRQYGNERMWVVIVCLKRKCAIN